MPWGNASSYQTPSSVFTANPRDYAHTWGYFAQQESSFFFFFFFPQIPLVVAQTVQNPPALQETRVQPEAGRSPGGRHGNPLQYSSLENPMDRGAWWATVHGVTKSWTRLSDFHFHFSFSNSVGLLSGKLTTPTVFLFQGYVLFCGEDVVEREEMLPRTSLSQHKQ